MFFPYFHLMPKTYHINGVELNTNYLKLDYNPNLKGRAKALRQARNLPEVLFWIQVNKRQFHGLDFDRQKIIGLSTSAGAAAGIVIDVGVGGASLMAGALAGGLVSGLASLAATWKPEKLKIKGVPLAGTSLTAGPCKELTFAFVLLGRAIDFLEMILNRTHADRSVAEVAQISFSERLKEFVNDVLGPDDDITIFEYTKKNTKEAGPALVGIELRKKEDYQPLLEQLKRFDPNYTVLNDNPVLFNFLV